MRYNYLSPEKIFNENFARRMERFGELADEFGYFDYDLDEKEIAAIRTANAVLVRQKEVIERLRTALQFYANEACNNTPDIGKVARQALLEKVI